ncbi:MAG: sugar phosphate isomerase/epimerase [Oscillospiraceae bacterium]|nr:sugar phosphate isomerase/epimerase [Oscillospiraceae bacterium]
MKLGFSNIGWPSEADEAMYRELAARGFKGLEIAPTRFVGEEPYKKPGEARDKARRLKEEYGLEVCSMQSIWFKRTERICASKSERASLIEYTKKAVYFALAAGCKNLVFGCPKNRSIEKEGDEELLFGFFKTVCSYAAENGVKIALEANPPIYNTNFLNDTPSACAFARKLGAGTSVNLDFGTIIENGEDIETLRNETELFSHVHISEPSLAPIERRDGHRALAALLKETGYSSFVSIEMRERPLSEALAAADYLAEVFA